MHLSYNCIWVLCHTGSHMLMSCVSGSQCSHDLGHNYKRPLIDEPVSWWWDTRVFLGESCERVSILGSTLEQPAQQDEFIGGQFASSQLFLFVTICFTSTDFFTLKQQVLHSRLTRLPLILLCNEEPWSPVFDQLIKPEGTTLSLRISGAIPLFLLYASMACTRKTF